MTDKKLRSIAPLARNRKFESMSLQRRVGCELGYCKGGPAASFRGRHKRVRDSNAAPHSDDVRTGSTAVAASRVGAFRWERRDPNPFAKLARSRRIALTIGTWAA